MTVTAAELENLIEADHKLAAKVEKYRTLREQAEIIAKQQKELKGDILSAFHDTGAQAFTYHGQVIARKQTPTTTGLDSKALKEALPGIWSKFAKVTETVRLWVY